MTFHGIHHDEPSENYAREPRDEPMDRNVARAIREAQKAIDAITAAYLQDGEGHTLPDVARMTGVSLALLRRCDRELAGGSAPFAEYRRWRDAVEQVWHRPHRAGPVSLWYPTRAHLRALLRQHEGRSP